MDSPVNMSSDIYKNIRGITGKNSRQIQKRHNRKVYYNENISEKCSRNYGSKLRCFTDEELKQTCSCMCKDGQTIAIFPHINGSILFVVLCLILIAICLAICFQKGLFDFSLKKLKNFIQYQPNILKVK